MQQPSRGIPTIGGDGEDGISPLSETFFGGDGVAVEEWLQSDRMGMPMFSLSEGPQQSAPTAAALAATALAAEAVTGTNVFPALSSKGVAEAPTSSAGTASAALPAAAPATDGSNSNSSSNSSDNSSSSSNNDTTSNHDSWWEATCVGALLRPFDPGKGCQRDARRGKAVLGVDLPFDRGKA